MPSYERPSSTAEIMLSSMSDKRSGIVLITSNDGSGSVKQSRLRA